MAFSPVMRVEAGRAGHWWALATAVVSSSPVAIIVAVPFIRRGALPNHSLPRFVVAVNGELEIGEWRCEM
jgi:hypothetical protein